MGKRGESAIDNASGLGIRDRTLNRYVGYASDDAGRITEVPIAECPSDKGDPLNAASGINNTYRWYGTSYLGIYGSWYRVKAPMGWWADRASYRPMRSSQIPRAANKVITTEWTFWGDRYWVWEGTRWHDNGLRDTRQSMVLFGDSHAEWFAHPVDQIEKPYVGHDGKPNDTAPADPSFLWW